MQIKNYENYSIDEYGNVTGSRGTVKPWISDRGYYYITLSKNNKGKHFRLHRLVAEHYLPGFTDVCEINHIDVDKANNHVSNLEITTRKQNCIHARDNGLSNTKLTIYEVDLIRRDTTLSGNQLAEIFGVSRTHIYRIRNNRRWGVL